MTSLTVPDKAKEALRPSALMLPEGLSFDEWSDFGVFLQGCQGSIQWWVGDWLNYGERRYGEKYSQATEQTGYEKHTLERLASVCGRIEISRRREILPFSHHEEVAYLEPDVQDSLLEQAEASSWSRKALREAVSAYKRALKGGEDTDRRSGPEKPVFSDVATGSSPNDANVVGRGAGGGPVESPVSPTTPETDAEAAEILERAQAASQVLQPPSTRDTSYFSVEWALGFLGEIRDELGVTDNDEILPAIRALKQPKVGRTFPSGFEAVWTIHRRGSKQKAYEQWRKVVPSRIAQADLVKCLRSYVGRELSDRFRGHDLFRWLRDERWEEYQGNGTRGMAPLKDFT